MIDSSKLSYARSQEHLRSHKSMSKVCSQKWGYIHKMANAVRYRDSSSSLQSSPAYMFALVMLCATKFTILLFQLSGVSILYSKLLTPHLPSLPLDFSQFSVSSLKTSFCCIGSSQSVDLSKVLSCSYSYASLLHLSRKKSTVPKSENSGTIQSWIQASLNIPNLQHCEPVYHPALLTPSKLEHMH